MVRKNNDSFGTVLYTFRKRARLSQQQLANLVGMHRHAIGRWEQGEVLPASKAIVLELARHLHLDDGETRLLLDASLTAPEPLWSVPFLRNPFFTGREAILETLHAHLKGDQTISLTQSYALQGLGGVGKTQTALEYAYRHALEYNAVFWIEAETIESVLSSLQRIAELLQLPEREEADQQHIVSAVQHWLSTHSQWLLIWDNLVDLNLLQGVLLPVRQGTILLTTHHQTLGTLALGIALASMEQKEGIVFVLRRAKVIGPEATDEQLQQFAASMPSEYAAAAELVTTMDGLPLALDQAGAYIEETSCSFADYVQRYRRQCAYLLDRRGGPGGDHPYSVTTTFLLAMERIKQEQEAAADLLKVCTFLHAEAIPEELFVQGAAHLGPRLEPLATNPTHFDLIIAMLRNLSLAQRSAQTHTLSLHRLVQVVLREQIDEHEQTIWLRRVIQALNAVFPDVTYEAWKQCERLIPHVLTCVAAFPQHLEDQELAHILQKAGGYLLERAQYEQAEPLLQRALRIWKQESGVEQLPLAHALNTLAFLYWKHGKYEQAKPLFEQALAIREKELGSGHSLVAQTLNNLAIIYSEQGLYEQAKPLFEQALAIRERELGAEHPLVAHMLNNLALIDYVQGKYEQAEPLLQRSVHIYERILPADHPDVARPLNNLAELYVNLGKYEQAELLYQRVLHIWEQAFGPEHPQVAHPLNGLADLYLEQRRYESAKMLYEQALVIREQKLGPEHPLVAQTLNNLANLYREQGLYEQAKSLYQRALCVRERHLGQSHPETAQTLYNLALLYQRLDDLAVAASLYRRTLTIQEQSLGLSHPQTVKTRVQSRLLL